MSLEDRDGRLYFYEKTRNGDRVISRYVANGTIAAYCAQIQADAQCERRFQREAERDREAKERERERPIEQWFDDVELLADACLIAAGFRCHKRGEWRRQHSKKV